MKKGEKTERGYQPRPGTMVDKGYQPQAATPVDPQNIKPPTGGSAIQPPKTPSEKK